MVEQQQTGSERLTEIAKVLGSYGFGHIYRTKIKAPDHEEDARQLRRAFETLGPTFIKFGQILSTRRDLLPQAYIDELAKLRDQAPPFPFESVRAIIEEDLEKTLEDVFEWFDPKPLASASVAQVHRGKLQTGEDIIVKVQRPYMEENMMRDIELFSRVIKSTPSALTDMFIDANAAIEEIKSSAQLELDFRNEAQAILRFKDFNRHRDVVNAPEIYPTLLSKRVLVEDYIDGIHNINRAKLVEAGFDPKDAVEKLVFSFLLHVFKDGFFHADPHQGNLIIKDQQIYFIDFGMHGQLTKANRERLLKVVQAIVFEDVDQLMNLILQMAIVKGEVDRFELFQDISIFFQLYAGRDLENLNIGTFFADLLKIAHDHQLVMPNDFVILARSITIIEGVASDIDGSISILEIAKRFLRESDEISFSDEFSFGKFSLNLLKATEDTITLPTSLRKVLRTVSEGRLQLYIDFADIDEKTKLLNKMINRMVFAIIIAALILASALVITSTKGTGLSILSIIIFVGAGLMGLWLLISIIRSGML